MAADTLHVKKHVSKLLDQVFGAVTGDAASPIAQNRALRQENATLKQQLALLRETDDAELDSLHEYIGRLHEQVAKLEDAYATLEAAHLEAAAEQSPVATPDKLAMVPVQPQPDDPNEAGVAREVAAVMHRVAPSLERLPGIEAQLGELAALKADMQAAVQALQQAREQPAQPRATSAEQLEAMGRELRALRKAVQQQQQQQDPGEPAAGAAAAAASKDGTGRAEQAMEPAAGVAKPGRTLADCPPLGSTEELGKRRQRPTEDDAPRAKFAADGAVRPSKDLATTLGAGGQVSPASVGGEITPRGNISPYGSRSDADPADSQQESPASGRQGPPSGTRRAPDRLVCAGQRTAGWQNYPWSCDICCLGFKGRFALARHFQSKGHIDFACDTYEYLSRRSATTNKLLPDKDYIANPFPRYNRQSGEEMRSSRNVVWRCQICDTTLNGLQHLTHQYSNRHRNTLSSILDGPLHAQPHAGASFRAA